MHAIEVKTTFSAAHALRFAGGIEPTHGHNFEVTVRISCQKLDPQQTVIDFHAIESLLEQILRPWHNQNLNNIDTFRARVNPSAERIAEIIGTQLQAAFGSLPDSPTTTRGLRLVEIRVTEATNCLAIWQP